MKHRHIAYAEDTPPERLPSAAIVDILERGDLDDWRPIAAAIAAEPHGGLAARVRRLLAAYPVYGTSTLWRAWIERCQARHEGMLRGRSPSNLARLRNQKGLTQAELAERMGMSQSDVSKLERRSDVKVSTLRSYAAALGYTLILECCDDAECVQVEIGDGQATNATLTAC